MTARRTVYLYPDDLERLRVLRSWYGLGTSAATRAGLALLLTYLQDEDEEAKRHALDTTVGDVRREKDGVIRVEIKHEERGINEFGYGVYVNGYVFDDYYGEDGDMGLYASECVPFGKNLEERTEKAEKRVRQNARNAYKKDFMQEN